MRIFPFHSLRRRDQLSRKWPQWGGDAIGVKGEPLHALLVKLDWGDLFNEPSMQVTACPPSQILSSSNSTATWPSRPTQLP